MPRKQYEERLRRAQRKLLGLHLALGGRLGNEETGPPVCVLFEGFDASGKGGAIRRLTAPLDPRHITAAQFPPPSSCAGNHDHFLWRFPLLPGPGGISFLHRSWYWRVLGERVEGIVTEEQWRRAYAEIIEFERSLVADGMILIKFWIHISGDEQLRRFKRRGGDPFKRWKLTDKDWNNHARRDEYLAAAEEMLERTNHKRARWHLVEGDCKRWARVKVLETTVAEIERGAHKRDFDLPSVWSKGGGPKLRAVRT